MPDHTPAFPMRVIVDTDPGIDDALAILLAVASPEIQVDGLTIVYGNCSVEQGAKNALAVLELAGQAGIPVYAGSGRPLIEPLRLAVETHGTIGLGYAQLNPPSVSIKQKNAVHFLIDHLLGHPGEISLIALGPLTNLALAFRMEPRLIPAVRHIFIMGGAINHPGNQTPLAEFNIASDPHAAHIVFHSGAPITLVPLDVTYQTILAQRHVDRLLQLDSPVSHFIADATRFYIQYHTEHQTIDGCAINDPLALAVVFAPHLVGKTRAYTDVDIAGGVSMGKTFADLLNTLGRPPNLDIALSVQADAFMELFIDRMQKLCLTVPA
jgi:purine nucleosidase